MRSRWIGIMAAGLATLTVMTGCGLAQAPGLAGLRSAGGAEVQGNKRKYKLGAKLDGKARIKYDEDAGGLEGLGFLTEREQLPARVDLRSMCPPVYDQGPLGSCTGFAIAKGLGEFLLKKHNRHRRLSALHLYYMERKEEGTLNRDAGAYISTGMEVLRREGVVREEDHPYPPAAVWDNDRKVKDYMVAKPNFKDADPETMFRFNSYDKQDTLYSIRRAINNGRPVVLGLDLYESFFDPQVERTGVVPAPDLAREKPEGGHAVLAVGYDHNKRLLIVRNSWGTTWGDNGYFYIPYEYIRLGLGGDAWSAFYDKDIIKD